MDQKHYELAQRAEAASDRLEATSIHSLAFTKVGVLFSLLAFLAAAGFGIWDALGDREWQGEQLRLLQEISAKLDQQKTANEIKDRLQIIGRDLELLSSRLHEE